MLTKRQKQVLDYIAGFIKEHDYAPTLEEIKDYFGLSSVATVHEHIETLRNKGFLTKIENQPRSIELNEQGEEKTGLTSIPLLGLIAAGEPIEAIEDPEQVSVPKDMVAENEDCYALKVHGDSMIDEGILDGDTVVIRNQATAKNGDTVVAIVNENEATLKKFYREQEENRIRLQPANQKLLPMFPDRVEIRGKVVGILRTFR